MHWHPQATSAAKQSDTHKHSNRHRIHAPRSAGRAGRTVRLALRHTGGGTHAQDGTPRQDNLEGRYTQPESRAHINAPFRRPYRAACSKLTKHQASHGTVLFHADTANQASQGHTVLPSAQVCTQQGEAASLGKKCRMMQNESRDFRPVPAEEIGALRCGVARPFQAIPIRFSHSDHIAALRSAACYQQRHRCLCLECSVLGNTCAHNGAKLGSVRKAGLSNGTGF